MENYFEYLDNLRESGRTNMFGAVPYLVRKFHIPADDARTILLKWMRTFSRDKTPAERAALADTESAGER